ncbi:hypothetical protein GCM10027596_20190 [Nocardioides korecus]
MVSADRSDMEFSRLRGAPHLERERRAPTACRWGFLRHRPHQMSRLGDQMSPLGRQMSPLGRHVSPLGRQMSPLGRRVSLRGAR